MASEFDVGALGPGQPGPEAEVDPALELADLAESLQAHIAWLIESGASGLPRDPEARARVQLQERELGALAVASASAPTPLGPSAAAPSASTPSVSAPSALPLGPLGPNGGGTDMRPRSPASSPAAEPARARLAPAPVVELGANLDELREKVAACQACGLCERRTQTVFARGTARGRLCFVGEGPGADEDAQGEPFVGKAGQLLDKMIAGMGFSRDEVYVCNVVKCRPPDNRKPTAEEMATCSPFLHRQLELIAPEVIVALGATALEGLLGHVGKITQLRGTFRLYRGRIAVMPTFHPAYVLRSPEARAPVWNDLKKVVQHMGRTLPQRAP